MVCEENGSCFMDHTARAPMESYRRSHSSCVRGADGQHAATVIPPKRLRNGGAQGSQRITSGIVKEIR